MIGRAGAGGPAGLSAASSWPGGFGGGDVEGRGGPKSVRSFLHSGHTATPSGLQQSHCPQTIPMSCASSCTSPRATVLDVKRENGQARGVRSRLITLVLALSTLVAGCAKPGGAEAVADAFGPDADALIRPDPVPDRWRIDLWAANRLVLRDAGVGDARIHVTDLPTGPAGRAGAPAPRPKNEVRIEGQHSNTRREGRWSVPQHMVIQVRHGNVVLDFTQAEFDDHIIDLHVYSGCGSNTIVVPRGVAIQTIRHRGGVDSRLDPPVPGFPLIRLDVTAMIGRVHLRHPAAPDRGGRRPGAGQPAAGP